MNHELKCWPSFFQAVWDGRKTFEIRKDDRGFQAEDTVTLLEYEPGTWPKNPGLTGRKIGARIGYVTAYEQKPGYCVFALFSLNNIKA